MGNAGKKAEGLKAEDGRMKHADFKSAIQNPKSKMGEVVSCQAREYKEWREKMGAKNEDKTRQDKTRQDTKPVFLFLIVAISTFAAETLVMFFLPIITPLPLTQEAIIDASVLTVLVFPSLYFFSFRPLVSMITVQKGLLKELQQSHEKHKKILEGTINALAQITEKKDPGSTGHQRRVSQLSTAIARELELSENQTEGIRMAGLFFDIGKIAIPAEILFKPDKMNVYEYNIFKTYPQSGYDILKDIEFPWPIAQIILQHQERMNGSGYPQGLSGKDILLEARILGVADVVENMATPRPYRLAIGLDKALEEIGKNKGVLYDTNVVDACVRLFKEKGFEFE